MALHAWIDDANSDTDTGVFVVATAGIDPDTDDDAGADTGVDIGAPTHADPPQVDRVPSRK